MTIQVEMEVDGSVMEAGNVGVDRADAGGILFSDLDDDILDDIIKLCLPSIPSVSSFRMYQICWYLFHHMSNIHILLKLVFNSGSVRFIRPRLK
jgi:hypothetical protein